MPDDLSTALARHFGHDAFRPGQEEVVRGLLDGRSMLAVFPTGGGKSLCYQLPAVLLEGTTLVVSPLIALMKDQVDALAARGIPAARLDSSLDREEAHAVLGDLAAGKLKLLYIAPERLANEGFRGRLERARLSLLTVDEAHCISEWGHNFRPDYLKIARLHRDLGIPRALCLSATATPSVADDIRAAFGIEPGDHVQLSFRRPNLALQVTPLAAGDRMGHLADRLAGSEGSAIVYVTRQETAESVATALQKAGHAARAYHAGLPDEVRTRVQEAFMAGETRVVAATIAFGMGIDKADIRHVFHFNLPKSLENYAQEIGRSGRDGQPSTCELLANADDLVPLENFIHGDTPEPRAIRGLLDSVLRLGDRFDLSLHELATAHDVRPLVISTLLTYLELDGILEATGSFASVLRVHLVRPLEGVLVGYNDRRQAFLRSIFGAAKHGRKWITFDLEAVAGATGVDRERIAAALHYLHEAGDLALQRAGIRQSYRLLRAVDDLDAIRRDLEQRFARRAEADLERLRDVVSLAEAEGCLAAHLAAYFGEDGTEACGQCVRCQGTSAMPLPSTDVAPVSDRERGMIHAVVGQKHAALRSSRQLARFLCGIRSPATSKARLGSHDAFALLERHPFREVLTIADQFVR